MEVKLTRQQVMKLSMHDAVFYSLSLSQNEQKDLEVVIHIEISDGLDRGRSLGKANLTRLIFKDVAIVRTNFYGRIASQDTIDSFEILEKTDLLAEANNWPSPLSHEAKHYCLKLHSGSVIEIVAEAIFLMESGR